MIEQRISSPAAGRLLSSALFCSAAFAGKNIIVGGTPTSIRGLVTSKLFGFWFEVTDNRAWAQFFLFGLEYLMFSQYMDLHGRI